VRAVQTIQASLQSDNFLKIRNKEAASVVTSQLSVMNIKNSKNKIKSVINKIRFLTNMREKLSKPLTFLLP
jgi:hypothetical protein